MKKTLYPLAFILSLVWFLLFRPVFLGGPASYIIVSGVSMEPTLFTGDLAVMQRRTSYSVEEIVAFRVADGNVIHRIVGGSPAVGFITRGDNKESIDPWQPKPEQILGRMWFHLPGWGTPLQKLRQPKIILALGGLGALLFLEDTKKEMIHRRGRRVKGIMKNKLSNLMTPGWALSLLGALVAFTLLCAAATVYGYLQPTEKEETVERLRYTHNAAFQYTVHSEPSLLYSREIIGPVGPDSAARDDQTTGEGSLTSEEEITSVFPPVFTRLANSLDLDFAYQLASPSPPEVQGDISVVLLIRAGDSWSKTETIVASAPFTGGVAATHATLDLIQIQKYLEAVEEQTGLSPGSYEIVLLPTVHLEGQIDGQAVEDVYAPPFTIIFNQIQLKMDTELARSETRTITEQVWLPNRLQWSGLAVLIKDLRLWGVVGALLGLVISSLLAAVVFLGIGLDKTAQLQARYGNLIVTVAASDLGTGQKVLVASMPDLVRLARRYESVVFHQVLKSGGDVYFVPDGQVIYTYRVSHRGEQE